MCSTSWNTSASSHTPFTRTSTPPAYNHTHGTGKGSRLRVEAPFAGFHVYATEWHPDRIDFFVDDRKFFTYAKEPDADEEAWPFDHSHHLILNHAIGGAWGGRQGIDEAIFPQRFEIDHVRVYRLVEQIALPGRRSRTSGFDPP